MRPTARRHHYLPRAYLAAFTDSGTKNGQFFVLDMRNGHSFRTSPKNVAAERDFNRINVERETPDLIEQALAPFEERAAQAIRTVLLREEFPNAEDCSFILNLLTLIAVRNPQLRNSFNRSRAEVMHRIADLLVSDKKIWDHHVKKVRAAEEVIKSSVSFEDVKQFVDERRYRIEFSPEGNLCIELRTFDKLLPILGQRTWSVLVAPIDGPEFVCSDHPVTLVWKSRRRGPIGYGLKETEVFFPLGRRVGFYGVFENPLLPLVRLMPGHIATMNTRVALNAERHVFSTLESFSIWHDGEIRKIHVGSIRGIHPIAQKAGGG